MRPLFGNRFVLSDVIAEDTDEPHEDWGCDASRQEVARSWEKGLGQILPCAFRAVRQYTLLLFQEHQFAVFIYLFASAVLANGP